MTILVEAGMRSARPVERLRVMSAAMMSDRWPLARPQKEEKRAKKERLRAGGFGLSVVDGASVVAARREMR